MTSWRRPSARTTSPSRRTTTPCSSAEKTDVGDQYIESYFQLSEQISSYQKQIKELQKTLNSLDASKEENAGLRKTLESQISILQRNLAAAEASVQEPRR